MAPVESVVDGCGGAIPDEMPFVAERVMGGIRLSHDEHEFGYCCSIST